MMGFEADDTMYEILVLQQSTLTPDEVACLERDHTEETTIQKQSWVEKLDDLHLSTFIEKTVG